MQVLQWSGSEDGLGGLVAAAAAAGTVTVVFERPGEGGPIPWHDLEPWVTSRAVTVADIRGGLASPGLEVALTCDLVFAREGARLEVPPGDRDVPPGLVWAAGRAGRAALARVLLGDGALGCREALDVGLVHGVVPADAALPVEEGRSAAAATAARDLMRASGRGAPGILELATFRLLFATGHPAEGARAFLERRPPVFEGGSPRRSP